ncbi:MAG: GTP cyclohydrolase [Methanomicrobiales archaeon]|nr:GTP cyclohydrolase [Methanomicrobiales archaeon]
MYLILLHYKKDLRTVDSYAPDHVTFLQKHYDLGHFLLSGRRIPRTGGVIIVRAENEEAVRAIISEDPFAIHDVTAYEIIPFIASMTSPELAAYREEIPGSGSQEGK